MHLSVLCGSENKQRLFLYTALTDWVFITVTQSVYRAVQAGSLYIVQVMCFVWISEQRLFHLQCSHVIAGSLLRQMNIFVTLIHSFPNIHFNPFLTSTPEKHHADSFQAYQPLIYNFFYNFYICRQLFSLNYLPTNRRQIETTQLFKPYIQK